ALEVELPGLPGPVIFRTFLDRAQLYLKPLGGLDLRRRQIAVGVVADFHRLRHALDWTDAAKVHRVRQDRERLAGFHAEGEEQLWRFQLPEIDGDGTEDRAFTLVGPHFHSQIASLARLDGPGRELTDGAVAVRRDELDRPRALAVVRDGKLVFPLGAGPDHAQVAAQGAVVHLEGQRGGLAHDGRHEPVHG